MKTAAIILIRCDGDSEVGLGHVVRCLALADELRDTRGFGVIFAMARGPVGFDLVQKAGYPFEQRNDNAEEGPWLQELIARIGPKAVILDVRNELSRADVEILRKQSLIVVIDDPGDRRLAADLAFYPPAPQVRRRDWTGFTGKLYSGWEWVILRRQFATSTGPKRNEPPVVLVTMGGSDPAGLTFKAIKALDLLDENFDTIVVLGPAFSRRETLNELLSQVRRRFQIRESVINMAELMAKADLAVASFAVTAYELAAAGVPGVFLGLTEDHAESASGFVESKIGISMGVFTQVSEALLAERVKTLLCDSKTRLEMASRCRQLADGRGAQRIARVIAQRLQKANVAA